MKIERRYIDTKIANPEGILLREKTDEVPYPVMPGYAAVFNSFSQNLGGFYEKIEEGFFRDAITKDSFEAFSLFNHDPNLVLGATMNGEVTVSEDKKGLYQETILKGDTTISKDVEAMVRAGRIYKMSFAFSIKKDAEEWKKSKEGRIERTLLAGGCEDLFDVSPVTYPAYKATSVGVRSHTEENKDLEKVLVALVSIERNLELSKEELEILKEFRNRADAYIERVPEVDQAAVLDMKRRILLQFA